MSDIRYERHGHVRLLTIDRAPKMNSLDFAANEELCERWREFAADGDARVAVVTGAGSQAFCAGADLKTYTMPFAQAPAPEFRTRFTDGPGFGGITRNLDVDKPVVAAVNGYALSGGLELALACDIRFCSPNAEFGLQDVKWGFHACDGGLIRLPWIIGLGNAMEIVLSGERIRAEHALRIGLVNRVIAAERLLEETLDYAQMLASRAPLAQRFAKQTMLRALGRTIEDGLRTESRSFADLAFTSDLAEGTTAFASGARRRSKGVRARKRRTDERRRDRGRRDDAVREISRARDALARRRGSTRRARRCGHCRDRAGDRDVRQRCRRVDDGTRDDSR